MFDYSRDISKRKKLDIEFVTKKIEFDKLKFPQEIINKLKNNLIFIDNDKFINALHESIDMLINNIKIEKDKENVIYLVCENDFLISEFYHYIKSKNIKTNNIKIHLAKFLPWNTLDKPNPTNNIIHHIVYLTDLIITKNINLPTYINDILYICSPFIGKNLIYSYSNLNYSKNNIINESVIEDNIYVNEYGINLSLLELLNLSEYNIYFEYKKNNNRFIPILNNIIKNNVILRFNE